MFNASRNLQFVEYGKARTFITENPSALIKLEAYFAETLADLIRSNANDIRRDFDEATHLYPFWQNYPPEQRGRSPVGDQFPWIEVGEHAIGRKLSRLLSSTFSIRDAELPVGPDERFLLRSENIRELTMGLTDTAWLFIDVKSVGPRDNFDHAVMSHNQISGDGEWLTLSDGVRNKVVIAEGSRSRHEFHCSVPPIYVLSGGTIAPVVHVVVKPIYKMLSLLGAGDGQPLEEIVLATIPNGLLLTVNPGYLKTHRGLLFPGKDDKGKDPRKVRARVSFEVLRTIAPWRVQKLAI